MLSIRFGEDREWWTSSGNFERLLSSAIQNGQVAPEHAELRDVAAANGGLDLLDDVDAVTGDRLVSGLQAAARHDLEVLTDTPSGSIDDSYRVSLGKFLEAVG
jgi:hypothetical protein